MYYALKYLSLADATVITFLGPFSTALAGHLLLGETYTRREALAGGKPSNRSSTIDTLIKSHPVCSLLGVVLIARPTFLFGSTAEGDDDGDITSFERLRAVG